MIFLYLKWVINTNTYGIHIDNIFDQKISLKWMNSSSVDHNFESACWTREFTAETNDAAAAIVTLFGTATTEIMLTWKNYHGFRKYLKIHMVQKPTHITIINDGTLKRCQLIGTLWHQTDLKAPSKRTQNAIKMSEECHKAIFCLQLRILSI